MKNAGFGKIFFLILVTSILTAISDLPVSAQSARPVSSHERRIDEINRQSEKLERENMNSELKKQRDSPEQSRQTQVLRAEIKEDLEHIQSAYNQIVILLQSGDEPSRDFIFETTDSIKKHAGRLAHNLSLPEPKEAERKENQVESFESPRKSLRSLGRHIFNFITNPIFDAPQVLDIEQAVKARLELDKIIQLSETIRENTGLKN